MREASAFAEARDAAVQLLLLQPKARLPVDVAGLQFAQKVVFDTIEHYCRLTCETVDNLSSAYSGLQDGATIRRESRGGVLYIVLYNEKVKNPARRRFTLAHEVGHICLGHVRDDDFHERLANCFASELLMPRVLVRELTRRGSAPLTAQEVAAVFGTSFAAARARLPGIPFRGNISEAETELLRRYSPCLPEREGPVIGF